MSLDGKQKAVLHVAKSRLGLTDAEYRDALQSRANVRSAADPKFSQAGFRAVMNHFNDLGFTSSTPKRTRTPKGKPALIGKVDAILSSLGLRRSYADAIAHNMFGVDMVGWCDADQLHRLVAALTYHQRRQARKESSG